MTPAAAMRANPYPSNVPLKGGFVLPTQTLHDQYLSTNEAAALLGLSSAALRQRRRREPPSQHPDFVRVGGGAVILYVRQSVEAYRAWSDRRRS